MDLKGNLEIIRKSRIKLYSVLTIPLDNAQTDFELDLTASYFYVLDLTGTASIRFNEISSDLINLGKNRAITLPFYRMFLTWTAQVGKILQIALGVQSDLFSIQDFSAPDVSIMSGYMQQLRDSFAYNQGTQITKSNSASAGGTTVIHQVTSGKSFILEHYGVDMNTGASNYSALFVTDDTDTLQYYIVNLLFTSGSSSRSSPCLILIPQNWKIKISTTAATGSIVAFIKGREI